MKLTKLEEQGLRLAMCMARVNDQMTLAEMAELEQLSEALVASVLNKLRRGGAVIAIRGRHGGYELAKPPADLTVADVLTSLGRPLLHGCFNQATDKDGQPCVHAEGCGLRPVWEQIEEQLTHVLTGITIADLLQREDQVRDLLSSFQPPRPAGEPADKAPVDRCRCGVEIDGEAGAR
jgi:Rrf2 family protein